MICRIEVELTYVTERHWPSLRSSISYLICLAIIPNPATSLTSIFAGHSGKPPVSYSTCVFDTCLHHHVDVIHSKRLLGIASSFSFLYLVFLGKSDLRAGSSFLYLFIQQRQQQRAYICQDEGKSGCVHTSMHRGRSYVVCS